MRMSWARMSDWCWAAAGTVTLLLAGYCGLAGFAWALAADWGLASTCWLGMAVSGRLLWLLAELGEEAGL